MFDAKKTAEELFTVTKQGELSFVVEFCGEHEDEFSDLADAQAYVAYRVEQMAKFAKKAKAGGIAEGWKQMMQAAAKVARERAEHHRGYCPTTCRCADGWHIAAAIESLPLEPQPLETKGTDNGP